METTVKIILSILLLLCLADMPYSYFQFVRLTALLGFSILAYKAYKADRKSEIIIFVALALIFQPFYKFAPGRFIWNVIDVIVALFLLISLAIGNKKRTDEK